MFKADFEAPVKGLTFDLPIFLQGWKLTASQAYRRVATAIDGDPREPTARADIFVIGENEYLVPDESRYVAGKLVESIIRLDRVQLIINRPSGTRQMREMELSTSVPASALAVLAKAVEEFNPSTFGYAVQIIRPQL